MEPNIVIIVLFFFLFLCQHFLEPKKAHQRKTKIELSFTLL
jgi:hypothetical protein